MASFECRCCGACCRWPGLVRLTDEDIAGLATFFSLSEEEFIREYTDVAPDRRSLVLAMPAEGACRFLTEDNRCRIHPAKPKQCRDFPLNWEVPPEFRKLCQGIWHEEEKGGEA